MKFLVLLVPMFLLFSCDSTPEYKYYCSINSQEERAMFVENCLKHGGAMQELVNCSEAAERLYCVWTNNREKAAVFYMMQDEFIQDIPEFDCEEDKDKPNKKVIFSWQSIFKKVNSLAHVVQRTTYQ